MTWNYRAVRRRDGSFGLHEVFYHQGGQPRAMTEQPVGFQVDADEGVEGLQAALRAALADAERHPILDETNVYASERSKVEREQ